MAHYSLTYAGITPVAVADTTNMTDAGYATFLQGGNSTMQMRINEVSVSGEAPSASTVNRMVLAADSTVAATGISGNRNAIRAGATADVTIAKLGAPIATLALTEVEKVLGRINGVMDQINSKEGFWQSILKESRAQGSMGGLKLATPEELAQLKREALDRELANQWNPASRQFTQDKIDRLNQAESAAQFAQQLLGAWAPRDLASKLCGNRVS